MIRRPPRATLIPCTTLFRSLAARPRDAEPPARAGRRDGRAGGAAIEFLCVPDERLEGLPTHDFTRKATWYRIFLDRKSTRLNSSHANISYAVFCLKKKNHCY